jgi:hypothetical protein
MAFSMTGIFAVLLELIRPFWLWLALLVAVEVLVLGALLVRRQRGAVPGWRPARPAALVTGVLGGVGGCVFALWWTQAGFDDLAGLLDFLAMVAVGVGAGIAIAVLSWPVLALLRTPSAP